MNMAVYVVAGVVSSCLLSFFGFNVKFSESTSEIKNISHLFYEENYLKVACPPLLCKSQ